MVHILWGLKHSRYTVLATAGNFENYPSACMTKEEKARWLEDANLFSTTICYYYLASLPETQISSFQWTFSPAPGGTGAMRAGNNNHLALKNACRSEGDVSKKFSFKNTQTIWCPGVYGTVKSVIKWNFQMPWTKREIKFIFADYSSQ